MVLENYKEKRDLTSSPEPRANFREEGGALKFVVHKHQASRLHYDLRLELDGVLESWAVPKGPSLDPKDKRLAVLVEEHPFDYKDFEGVIPEGNYGAGTVMIWDSGTYYPIKTGNKEENEREIRDGLHKGHITFILEGEKLKGEFALVRLRKGGDKDWLLIKANDRFAGKNDFGSADQSVATGRSMEEITREENENENLWRLRKGGFSDVPGAEETSMPHDLKPMKATLIGEPFDSEGWMFEIKWDGYRAIAEVEKGKVRLFSRNNKMLNQRFSPIPAALSKLKHDVVLDGEIVVVDEKGRSRFQLIQDYQKEDSGILVYYVFDLLYLDGVSLMAAPLEKRKELLSEVLGDQPIIRISEHVFHDGKRFFEAAKSEGLEGIMAKKRDSIYRPGVRVKDWLKIKNLQQQEAVIGGFTQPQGRRSGFGALVVGVYQNRKLVYIGHVGGGFDQESLEWIEEMLRPLARSTSPFDPPPKTNAPVTWVEPRLVCEVKFQEWTGAGTLRQPVFLGFRDDLDPATVTREIPQPVRAQEVLGKSAEKKIIGQHKVNFTNLDKVLWPQEGYTKEDLIAYYEKIADYILPYLRGRPQSLNRYPNGIEAESFYQKNVEDHPDWVRIAEIPSESKGEVVHYVVCDDKETLLYLANLACIEINVWNSKAGTLDNPDYLVIDLDPKDIDFDAVVEAALAVREVFGHFGVECFCKTSGATGMHVYVPMGAKYSFGQVREFAKMIALLANRKLPDITSLARKPEQRQNRVYLDFLQNRLGATMAIPYSIRPRPAAPVSTPLAWDEVEQGLDPDRFTMKNIPERIAKMGDSFLPVLGQGIDLREVLS